MATKVISIDDPKYKKVLPGAVVSGGPAQTGPGIEIGRKRNKKNSTVTTPTFQPTEQDRLEMMLMLLDTVDQELIGLLRDTPDSKSLNKAKRPLKKLKYALQGRQAALSVDELPF